MWGASRIGSAVTLLTMGGSASDHDALSKAAARASPTGAMAGE